MAVIGPSTALARIDALAPPVANSSNSRASKIVPTPIVTALFGTLSGSPPNMAAFCLRVTGVSAFSRVRDISADKGSLKPIWPASPIPKSCTSIPPCLSNQLLVPRSSRAQIGGHAVRDARVGKVNIHPTKQVMIHVKSIGMLVLGRHANVFVQVKRS